MKQEYRDRKHPDQQEGVVHDDSIARFHYLEVLDDIKDKRLENRREDGQLQSEEFVAGPELLDYVVYSEIDKEKCAKPAEGSHGDKNAEGEPPVLLRNAHVGEYESDDLK